MSKIRLDLRIGPGAEGGGAFLADLHFLIGRGRQLHCEFVLADRDEAPDRGGAGQEVAVQAEESRAIELRFKCGEGFVDQCAFAGPGDQEREFARGEERGDVVDRDGNVGGTLLGDNTPARRFPINAGYQAVAFTAMGAILGAWQ